MKLAKASGWARIASLIGFGVGIAIAITMLLDLTGSSSQTVATPPSARLGGIHLSSCEEQQPGVIALLGRLAPGHSVAELASKGLGATQAIEGGDADLIVIYPGSAEPDVSRLRGDASLRLVAPLLAQTTTERELRSCDYRLADKPEAAAIAAAASKAMIEAGLLTSAQIGAGGTMFLLSDDPTDPNYLFLTISTAIGFDKLPASPAKLSGARTAYVAVVDRTTRKIVQVGKAHWYDGQ